MSEPCALDQAVFAARTSLAAREFEPPACLYFLSTGAGTLPSRLSRSTRVVLGRAAGVPDAWKDALLYIGRLERTPVWILEDAAGAPEHGLYEQPGAPAWQTAFPIWLARAAGARVCVHTSAGSALPVEHGAVLAAGTIALVADHLNLSGRTPLAGLGGSQLGPLFPDTSRLHHAGLRRAAARHAKKLGLTAGEAIAAATAGPALETHAERVYWARAGASIAVQRLSDPLLACAHAGLAVLSLVCVTDAGGGAHELGSIVARALELAPQLEDLLAALAKDAGRAAAELAEET